MKESGTEHRQQRTEKGRQREQKYEFYRLFGVVLTERHVPHSGVEFPKKRRNRKGQEGGGLQKIYEMP
jgi:hypothetical protein